MKKIAIITLIGNNYGNRLQNYAVQQILRKNNYDVFTVRNNVFLNYNNYNLKNNIKYACSIIKHEIMRDGMYRINNSLTDFHLKHKRARPLRVKVGKTSTGKQIVLLINDCKYSVEDLYLSYIKTPEKLTSANPMQNPEYKDFEDDVWYEIIKIAAQMYVENKQEQRYSTLTNEVLTQE